MKIRGNTVGTPLPKSNFDQVDPRKGDYIGGDRSFMNAVTYTEQTLTEEQKAQVRANMGVYQLAGNVHSVAHRGYSTEAPENTLSAYRLAATMGFQYVECDVAPTVDGVPVLIHDDTVDRTSNGSGNISEMTFAEVRELDFGSWKNEKYTGEKIPSFEEFVILCKHKGLRPYVEIKATGSNPEKYVSDLVNIVKRCGMVDKVTWISFSSYSLGLVKSAYAKARLGFVVGEVTEDAIAWAVSAKTADNEVFIDAEAGKLTKESVNSCVENSIPLEVWTVNSEDAIINLDKYVTGVTSDSLRAAVVLYDAPIPETEPPAFIATIGRAEFSGDGNNRLIVFRADASWNIMLLSKNGGMQLYDYNDTSKVTEWYAPKKPEGATKVTIVCPGLRYSVREYKLNDNGSVINYDHGWQPYGGGEYAFRHIDCPYFDIIFGDEASGDLRGRESTITVTVS